MLRETGVKVVGVVATAGLVTAAGAGVGAAAPAKPGGSVRAQVVCDNTPDPWVKPLINHFQPAPVGRSKAVGLDLTGLRPGHAYRASYTTAVIGRAASDGALTVPSTYVKSPSPLPDTRFTRYAPGDAYSVTVTDVATGAAFTLTTTMTADPACGTLQAGLAQHQRVTTWRGPDQGTACVLVQQSDGNLVYRNEETGAVIWSSGTAGNPGARTVMRPNGNLVVYSAAGAVLFQTRTAGHPGASLSVQSDGNLVVYEPTDGAPSGVVLWQSGTAGRA